MSFIIVDVESDGPVPHLYSMVSFGAIILDRDLETTFYGETKPISEKWIPEALAVSGISRETHLGFNDPKTVMEEFNLWIEKNSKGRPVFVSDNNGFDWQWINYYFHLYLGKNPFGFSSRRIGDIYCGLKQDMYVANEWKKLRRTKHTHNPVDDAKGNAEALQQFRKLFNLKIGY